MAINPQIQSRELVNMSANSAIFTTTLFGNSSGATAAELTAKDRAVQEAYLATSSASSMKTKIPTVPSNQRIAKDK